MSVTSPTVPHCRDSSEQGVPLATLAQPIGHTTMEHLMTFVNDANTRTGFMIWATMFGGT